MTWFCALGEPLGEERRAEIAAYLQGLGMDPTLPVRAAAGWSEAGKLCRRPADTWWNLEESERKHLEQVARLNPAEPEWLALSDQLRGASAMAAARAGCSDAALIQVAAGAAGHAAYQARLAQAAGAASSHPFLRKFALYRGGRWPLGVYDGEFAIF